MFVYIYYNINKKAIFYYTLIIVFSTVVGSFSASVEQQCKLSKLQ